MLVGQLGIVPLLGLYPSWHDLPYDILPMLIEGFHAVAFTKLRKSSQIGGNQV